MSGRLVRLIGLALALAAFVAVAPGCGPQARERPAVAFTPVALGPVATFERVCARCHGPQGSFYGEEFARLIGADLRKFVLEMMEGPGLLDPSARDVEAMIAYHRALAAAEPFLCVTQYRPRGPMAPLLAGEVSPGATVKLHKGSLTIALAVSRGGKWSVPNPPAPPFTLVAKLGRKRQQLCFPSRQWTHSRR